MFRAETVLQVAAVWAFVVTMAVLLIVGMGGKPAARAVVGMGATLLLLWGGLGLWLMHRHREAIVRWVNGQPWPWPVRFVSFCTVLALAEEAITVTLTNLAPLFGVPYGAAYITASGNYLDVVCLHSVVVFVPMFVCWAVLLRCRAFRPAQVFLLFGLTGSLAEFGFGSTWAQVPFWIFIYGPMVYLPACCMPTVRDVPPAGWGARVLAVFLPFLFAAPVALVVSRLHPVKIHFPPISG